MFSQRPIIQQTHTQQQTQHQTQKQLQLLSPKLIQMLSVFQLSYQDMNTLIQSSVADNPALDLQLPLSSPTPAHSVNTHSGHSDHADDISDFVADTRTDSLEAVLRQQLNYTHLNAKDHAICLDLIDAMDRNGYITDYTALKSTLMKKHSVQDRKIGECLAVIQSFEPEGVGARTLTECLLIQLNQHNFSDSRLQALLKKVIQHHLTDLGEERYETVADTLSLTPDAVRDIHTFIRRNFSPYPGLRYQSGAAVETLTPSFDIRWQDNELVITNLEKRTLPTVSVSKEYLAMLSDPSLDAQSKAFIEGAIQKARDLQELIQQRYENLDRLVQYIAHIQVDFFKVSPHRIRPLLQKEVSQHLGISASTVSRILSNKSFQTNTGVFLLKTLCPRRYFGKSKAQLLEVVRSVCEQHPLLSDQKLVLKFREMGVPIARRTVAEYRRALGIPSSYGRFSG